MSVTTIHQAMETYVCRPNNPTMPQPHPEAPAFQLTLNCTSMPGATLSFSLEPSMRSTEKKGELGLTTLTRRATLNPAEGQVHQQAPKSGAIKRQVEGRGAAAASPCHCCESTAADRTSQTQDSQKRRLPAGMAGKLAHPHRPRTPSAIISGGSISRAQTTGMQVQEPMPTGVWMRAGRWRAWWRRPDA